MGAIASYAQAPRAPLTPVTLIKYIVVGTQTPTVCISSFIGAEGHLKLTPFPSPPPPKPPRGRLVADEFSPGPVNSNVIDAR